MAEEHSTFGDICNTILQQAGLPKITDTEAFNSRSGLQRPHSLVIAYVDDADAKLVVRLTEIFTGRRFVGSTTANQKTLDVNELTDLEGIKYQSLRLVDRTGRRLNFMPYHIWREYNPDLDNLRTGSPESWTYWDQPEEDGLEQTTKQIVLYPVPDATYQIEYSAKVNHQKLVNFDAKILWPSKYEHVLTGFGRSMLEEKMGTGDYSAYAQAALDNVRQWATGAADKVKKASFGGAKIGTETNWKSGDIGYYWEQY